MARIKLRLRELRPDAGSVTLRAVFPNPKNILLPGMFVRARVEEGVNDRALLVPQVGVTHDPSGQATVLVMGADNKVAALLPRQRSSKRCAMPPTLTTA